MSAPANNPELVSDGMPAKRPGWVELATSGDHKDIGRMLVTGGCFLVVAALGFVLMRLQLAVPENDLYHRRSASTGSSERRQRDADLLLRAASSSSASSPTSCRCRSAPAGSPSPGSPTSSFWLFAGRRPRPLHHLHLHPARGRLQSRCCVSPTRDLFGRQRRRRLDPRLRRLAQLGIVLLAVNLLATVRTMRAPGMAWRRLPVFSWGR